MELEKLKGEYAANKTKIKELRKAIDTEQEKTRESAHVLRTEYRDKINALKEERDSNIKNYETAFDMYKTEQEYDIEGLSHTVAQVDRYIEFLKIANNFKPVESIKDESVTRYERSAHRHLEWLGYLYTDDFLKIRLLIAENDKPKNKYSLMVYGRCVFSALSKNIIDMPHNYGGPNLNDGYTFDIKDELRCAPSVDDLNAWVIQNRHKILAEFMDQFKKIKAEYLEVTRKYTLDDFKELIPKEE